MSFGHIRTAAVAALGLIFATSASQAVPVAETKAETEASIAYMPFDPPLETPLRYRWEKIVSKDGKTEVEWDISSYTFRRTEDGFSLTVMSLESGSNETDPTWLAVEERLKPLLSQPFILQLSVDGRIIGLDDADRYWNTIFRALEEGFVEFGNDGKPLKPEERKILVRVLSVFRDMSPEARLSLLTESIQPVLEFAETEVGDQPLIATIESASPFGGMLEHEIRITLDRMEQDLALLSVHSSISPEGLRNLTNLVVGRLAALANNPLEATERKEVEAATAAMKIQHETGARYRVSTVSGLAHHYEATETMSVEAPGTATRKVTVRSLKRLD